MLKNRMMQEKIAIGIILLDRNDSSTGIGQIFVKTALDAEKTTERISGTNQNDMW